LFRRGDCPERLCDATDCRDLNGPFAWPERADGPAKCPAATSPGGNRGFLAAEVGNTDFGERAGRCGNASEPSLCGALTAPRAASVSPDSSLFLPSRSFDELRTPQDIADHSCGPHGLGSTRVVRGRATLPGRSRIRPTGGLTRRRPPVPKNSGCAPGPLVTSGAGEETRGLAGGDKIFVRPRPVSQRPGLLSGQFGLLARAAQTRSPVAFPQWVPGLTAASWLGSSASPSSYLEWDDSLIRGWEATRMTLFVET